MKFKIILLLLLSTVALKNSNATLYWNNAAVFAGNSGSYISIPNSGTLNISGNFTLEAWINPSTLAGTSKGIISKGGALGSSLKYGMRLKSNGTISVLTNGVERIASRQSQPIQINQWTHVACTYDFLQGHYKIFINGQLDTSATVTMSTPTLNTDSLFIGISGASTPFKGKLDEIRIWGKTLTIQQVEEYYRSGIGTSKGVYNFLNLSMTFQVEDAVGNDFTARDFSGNGNNGHFRSVTAEDQSNNLYETIHPNESAFLDGTSYMTAVDTLTLDAQTAVTIECWIYPLSSSACTFISKGGASSSYSIGWTGSNYIAKINNTSLNVGGPTTLPTNRWTHLSFRYKGTGEYALYVNGSEKISEVTFPGNIIPNSDSLFIGGGASHSEFNGYIDEIRISKNRAKTTAEIQYQMHASINLENDPVFDISYNLDGYLHDNCNKGPDLNTVRLLKFSHPGTTGNPVSPVSKHKTNTFFNGYNLRMTNKSIPSIGEVLDTIQINQSVQMSDVNVFVAMTHQATSQLNVVLIAPNGDSVTLIANATKNSLDQSLVCVFDDESPTSIINNKFISFTPEAKPSVSIDPVFQNDFSQGNWRLKVRDQVSGSSGFITAWGIQINNQTVTRVNSDITCLIHGFYNPASNTMTSDTMKVFFRESNTPYNIVDSSSAFVNSQGKGLFTFPSYLLESKFYLEIKHRNSIETWSGNFFNTTGNGPYSYDFITGASNAFGDNQIQIDFSPVRFAIYGADVNRDDVVDLSDITLIFNDANIFNTGYIATDVTGDSFADLSDVTLAFNNSNNFVAAIVP